MIFDVVQVGDPVLRSKARALAADEIGTPFVQELIASMRQTMHAAGGVGLAAPQVGESLQVVVMEDDNDWLTTMSQARQEELGRTPLSFTVLINPELHTNEDQEVEAFEGCLSLSGFSALARRQQSVMVRALNEHGEAIEACYEGWPARIVQHEIDHLVGRLYVDLMDPRTLTTTANLGRYWKARPASAVHAQLDEAHAHPQVPSS